MIIKSLQKKGNNVVIFLDNSDSITVGYETAVKNGLRKNDVLTDAKLKELQEESIKLKIKESIFKLLARRNHSALELKRKLLQKRYDKKLIEDVINELIEKEYINDSLFAENFYKEEMTKKNLGENRLRADLFKKGINKKIIDEVINKNRDPALMLNNAVFLAAKKINYLKKASKEKNKIKQKVFSYLQNKGFDSDTIREVFRQMNLEIEEN